MSELADWGRLPQLIRRLNRGADVLGFFDAVPRSKDFHQPGVRRGASVDEIGQRARLLPIF